MEQINYKEEVLKVYPGAFYMHFGASRGKKHHIRLYTRVAYGETLGDGDNEEQAWEQAYNNINK